MRASYDRKKLNTEASFTEGLMRSWEGLFQPKEPELTPEELEAQERREASSEATAKALQSLKLSVQAGEDDEGMPIRRAAPISVLQSKAKQSIVLFAVPQGKERLITDVLLSMRIEAKDFSERNVLVVPAIVDVSAKKLVELPPNIRDAKLIRQGAIALPLNEDSAEDAWGATLAAEFEEAQLQGTDEVLQIGLALILGRDGSILRRGFGRPSWKVVFSETDTL